MQTVELPPKSDTRVRHVLIVEDQSLIALGLKADVERLGHVVVGLAATAQEARQLVAQVEPDLILMDIRLGRDDGIELTRELLAQRPCPVVIVSAFSDCELALRAAEAGVFGYLVKPVSPESLQVQIEVATRRFADSELCRHETDKLRHDNQELVQTLETRKLVERAKGLLMKRLNLDEQTAHRRLQLESQKRRISIGDCARRVIDAEKALGN
jgi:two-component system, response regulator PdtaR